MRVLFIPCVAGARSHGIPLLALARRLNPNRHEWAFLLPAELHALFGKQGAVLGLDYQYDTALRAEMAAIRAFRPDVIVDDLSFTAILSSKLSGTPRVAIQRTGVFAGATRRNDAHRHSCAFDFSRGYRGFEMVFGGRPPTSMPEVCAAGVKIIPGIRSVEVLPAALAADASYVFAGSLVLDDDSYGNAERAGSVESICRFLDANHERPLVYLTMGHMHFKDAPLPPIVGQMIDAGMCVISNVAAAELTAPQREAFYYAPILPMHTVCSRARLMIHHCGSGTYQYALLHAVPSLCVGTGCYDRDDVAIRLDELGVAKYVPGPAEGGDFSGAFHAALEHCLAPDDAWHQQARHRLIQLQEENERTMAAFDVEAVLERSRIMTA